MKTSLPIPSFSFRVTTALAALFTFLLIVIGATVRVSGSGLGCPDWPLCHGSLIPPFEFHTLFEYSHRLTTTLVTLLVIGTAVWATWRYRANQWIVRSARLAVALLVVQILVGGVTVLFEVPPTIVAIHLGIAMLLFAATLTVAASAWQSAAPAHARTDRREGPDLWLALASAAAIFVTIVSGSVVEGSGAAAACPSWPLCDGTALIGPGVLPFVHMLHRAIVAVAGLLALYTFYRAIRYGASNRAILAVAWIGALALITQVGVGAAQVWLRFPPLLEGAHVALAAATWGSLVLLANLLVPRGEVQVAEPKELKPRGKPVRTSIADYLGLTKPWIVALLLTTTVAGMLVAARGLPPLNVFLLTLVGGAFAAGGANALNSYIDRDVDKVMGRTSRRPLPSGRVSPRGAMIFALTLSLLSPIILGFGVNWLSAGLAVLGIIYYAGIYTILLKRATPQNIVVGGAAGAIPPLVGWAAVSNNVSLLGLYLFAIILLWTPPHTWALMLLLDKDYNKARIPMLPAAWGQVEARRQIILYSVLLVAITLVPVSIGALGVLYLVGALALGVYFLMLAYRLWRNGETYKPIARKLYHFSNAYLFILFLMMVLDHWLAAFKL
jgi:heme o synthase